MPQHRSGAWRFAPTYSWTFPEHTRRDRAASGRLRAAGPRLAPAALGMPATVQICASSAVVVDLPLVPVMPANFARQPLPRTARYSSSASVSTGTPCATAQAACSCGLGNLCGMPGESTSASSRPGTSEGRMSVKSSARASQRARRAANRPRRTPPRPSSRSARAAGSPARPRPSTAKRWPCEDRCEIHRIFKVASPTSPRIIATIQKRITMVGSAQPFFSK